MADTEVAKRTSPPFSRDLRAAVHLAALAFAFPLTWVAASPRFRPGEVWAAAGCLLLFVFNLLILPHTKLGERIKGEGDGQLAGLWLYPLALATAFLIYPAYAVGAAWAALAAGDATAVVCGARLPRPALSWNPKKSWTGLLAFFVAAVPACALLLWWCPVPLFLARDLFGRVSVPEWQYVWTLAILAGFAGAVLESLPGPFDDNLRLPLGVGLVTWLTALFLNFGTSGLPEARAFQPEWLLHALVVNAILVGLVWALKFATLPGALAGGVIGVLVYFFALPPGYALLVLFVAGGSALSHLGRATKEARGAAEAQGGQRGLANVVANLSVPALCVLAYPASKAHPAALWAFAGALAAAFADTASAEIGALSPRQPILITTRQPVKHGTNGGVSWLGYVGAAAACILLAAAAWGGGFWRIIEHGHAWNTAPAGIGRALLLSAVLIAAGLVGTTVDSLLGATLEDRVRGVNKHAVNFVCALAGAAVAGGAGMLLTP